jgi:hypothetical protein
MDWKFVDLRFADKREVDAELRRRGRRASGSDELINALGEGNDDDDDDDDDDDTGDDTEDEESGASAVQRFVRECRFLANLSCLPSNDSFTSATSPTPLSFCRLF